LAENKPSKLVGSPNSVKAAKNTVEVRPEVMNRSAIVIFVAIAFEGALGLAGWGLATRQDVPLAARIAWNDSAAALATRVAVATIPILLLLAFVTRSSWRPIAELRSQVEQLVGELFQGVGWFGLAVISAVAGLGEEILFRGAVQPIAERWFGYAGGLVLASLLFGAAHAVTRTYFMFAVAVGLYFGWLAQYFGELLTPIIVHAVYDFVALVVLVGKSRSKVPFQSSTSSSHRHGTMDQS
jgi:uncharacterized protein